MSSVVNCSDSSCMRLHDEPTRENHDKQLPVGPVQTSAVQAWHSSPRTVACTGMQASEREKDCRWMMYRGPQLLYLLVGDLAIAINVQQIESFLLLENLELPTSTKREAQNVARRTWSLLSSYLVM